MEHIHLYRLCSFIKIWHM